MILNFVSLYLSIYGYTINKFWNWTEWTQPFFCIIVLALQSGKKIINVSDSGWGLNLGSPKEQPSILISTSYYIHKFDKIMYMEESLMYFLVIWHNCLYFTLQSMKKVKVHANFADPKFLVQEYIISNLLSEF